ncbi:MAG: hypothetical protein KY475_16745 [Planctomycetes bacterium]|nr:hypothetical protein [Planctomycetota bacterium]
MMFLTAAMVILQAIMAALGLVIWLELRKLREALCAQVGAPRRLYRESVVSSRLWYVPQPFAIWKFSGKMWQLEHATVPPGYQAGAPPAIRGVYEGQRVKTACVKNSD